MYIHPSTDTPDTSVLTAPDGGSHSAKLSGDPELVLPESLRLSVNPPCLNATNSPTYKLLNILLHPHCPELEAQAGERPELFLSVQETGSH